MLTGFQGTPPVVFERQQSTGETEQVRLDATVIVLSPTGKARDTGDPRPALAAALAHCIQRANDPDAYAERINSGEPSNPPLRLTEEVPML